MSAVDLPSSLSIDVVIPTFNGWDLTRSCLEHLERQTVSHTVIVAENASSDGTPRNVRSTFPEARLVELYMNKGFAAACNHGVRGGSGDVVVLLNNDVDCPPDFVERLVAPLRSGDGIGSAAAVLVRPDERTIDSVGLTVDTTLAGFPRLRGRPVEEAGLMRPVLTGPAGAAGAYRRAAWEQVGGLDERVFMYGEDVDLALRLRTTGWATALAPDAVAVHRGSATALHRSSRQRFHGGFARGYFARRYGVLHGDSAARAAGTEAVVVVGDAVLSRDLSALRGRIAGWRAAGGLPRRPLPPGDSIDEHISFLDSLRLRRRVYEMSETKGAPM